MGNNRGMEDGSQTQTLRPVRAEDLDLIEHPGLQRLFGDDREVRARFVREASTVLVPGGHLLFSKGDPAEHLYLVLHGRLEVFDPVTGAVEAEVGTGELSGERAMIVGGTRTGSVRAMRDTELLELSRDSFDNLVARHPHAMMHLARAMATRLTRLHETADRRGAIATIAIVPVHGGEGVEQFARRLRGALARHGTARRVDAAALDVELGRGASTTSFQDLTSLSLTKWMNRLETENRFVIYQADQQLTPWSRRCIRQADRVLLVADRAAAPAPGPVEAYLADDHEGAASIAGRELILLERGGRAAPVGDWLGPRQVLSHHFVDPEQPEDIERVARFLAGAAIGLVLSGGGARTCAHLGVARALREAGIPIDLVGGTSGGAIFGAQLALGWSPDEMLERSRSGLVDGGRLFDMALPVHGLIEGRRFKQMLQHMYGDTLIEDLRTPFFCVSTNLSAGAQAVHTHGLLWRWVRASMSVPGLGPPLFDQGEVYVDGSVLNNLPIDVMRERTRGPIIAVNVGATEGPRAGLGVDQVPSALSMLKGRLLGRHEEKPHIPGIIDVLLGSAMIGGVRASRAYEGMADLIIRPKLDGFGQLEFSALEAMAQRGYEAGVAALEGFEGHKA